MAANGRSPPPSASASTRTRWSQGLTAANFLCGSSRLSVTVRFRLWGSSDRLRVRPHTSVRPTPTRAGTRELTASITAPAIRSARNWVQAGSKPGRLEANRL